MVMNMVWRPSKVGSKGKNIGFCIVNEKKADGIYEVGSQHIDAVKMMNTMTVISFMFP